MEKEAAEKKTEFTGSGIEVSTFLGHDIPYWLELERQSRNLAVPHLIDEIAGLRARNRFYEQCIKEMNLLMQRMGD